MIQRYIPCTLQYYAHLPIEFSLPHLVFGNNTNLIRNFEKAINQATDMLPEVPGILQLDPRVGVLNRLDIYYNFHVGSLVPYYIQALLPLKYPRRHTRPYSDQEVQYGNNLAALKLYDKELWYVDQKLPVNPDAQGVLCLEVTLRKAAIQRLTRQKYPTLQDITIKLALLTLEKELQCVGLLDRSIGTYDTTLHRLSETFGTDAGFCYFGALAAKVEYPNRDTIITVSGIHPRTMDRRLKKVLDSGLPLTMTKIEEPQPTLNIDREMVMEKVRRGASVMKYQVIPQANQNSVGS